MSLYERKPGQVAAMYVGRSNSLTDRLLSHSQPENDHYSAPFAFLIAKSKFPRSADLSAKELQADLEFQKHSPTPRKVSARWVCAWSKSRVP